jgi:hypothetical protein
MMPETGGLRGHVVRGIERSHNQCEKLYPRVAFLDMPVTGTVEDTKLAARLMRSAEVACIVGLGGGFGRKSLSPSSSDALTGMSQASWQRRTTTHGSCSTTRLCRRRDSRQGRGCAASSSPAPFLDVRVAVLGGTLKGSFRRMYFDFRPANDHGTMAAAA